MPKDLEKNQNFYPIQNKNTTLYQLCGKRMVDIIIAFTILITFLPIFFLIAILIKLDTRGPILYKQKRVGKATKEFYVFKFRTMVVNADRIGPTSTHVGDIRITKVGTILRKLSLDELPQLINVLIGDMSIVGYRPGVKENFTDEELKSGIFSLRPGITGFAQVNGRSSLTKYEKRQWEMKYVEEVSFITDMKVLYKTVKKVIKKEAAY